MSSLPITLRLLLSYVLVAVLPLAGLAAFYLASFEASLRETIVANMDTIADKKAEQIDSYMAERLNDASSLSQMPLTREAIIAFEQAFRAGGLKSPAYLAAELKLRDKLVNQAEAAGYYDLLLMDAAGNVVFSVQREADLGTNLRNGPYRQSQLAQGFDLAVRTLQHHLTRFAPYAPSGQRAAAFVVAPILENGIPVGALALQVDMSKMEPVVADRTGLGRSGETVLAQRDGNDALYMAPLRLISDAALSYRVPLRQTAQPMQQALAGGRDRGLIRDYAGVECVAAWRYLPALRWGMVVKIDTGEALAPAARLRRITYLALALFLALSGVAAFFLGRSLSRPIGRLTGVAERIADGELSLRAAQGGRDELGRLANAFNYMADCIRDQQVTLARRVEERTRELQNSKAQYDELVARIPVGVYVFRIYSDGKMAFEYVSPRFCRLFNAGQQDVLADVERVFSLLHPDDLGEFMALKREAVSTLQPFLWEGRFVIDRQTRWFRLESTPTLQPNGDSVWNGVVSDITERKIGEESTHLGMLRLNEAQRIAQVGSWELDVVSGELLWSDEIFRIFEIDQAIFGASYDAFLNAIHPADRDRVNQAYGDSLVTRAPYEITHRLLMQDGRTKWVNEHCETLYDGHGKAFRSMGTVQDITERKQAEEAMRLYASVFEHSAEGILISDQDNCILAINPAFNRMTGYSIEDVRGENPRMFASGHTLPQVYRDMWAMLGEDGCWQGEIWDRRKDGSIYPKWMSVSVVRDLNGILTHYISSFTDITERKAVEAHISHLAHHDALTGLLNRFSLQDRLEQALALAKRERRPLAVMFIDMDRFKTINDTLGHAVGDELLVEVAHRLRACVRDSDIVARLGGDEFVLALTEVDDATTAARLADKILHALGRPYQLGENELHSTPSIGLAFYPDDGGHADMLMKNADTAMYHAKAQGRNNVQFFTAEMNRSAVERLQLERDLRVAVETGQFELHYQPQLDAVDGRIVGVEALVRWRHPRDGLVSPARFIPIAEEMGLIVPLGEWVLNEACRELRVWREQGVADVTMAVNLSAQQLHSPLLLEYVAQTLAKHGLSGADLELEVTESVAMHNPEASIGKLKALRDMGLRLSIDDFGTGYSSLSYLKLLPIHTLKLDQSFVRDIETDENDVAICAATIALAHTLGLTVVAEGVETDAQRYFLTVHKCDFLQGYLFSKPVPAEAALAFIQERIHSPIDHGE